MMMRAALSRKPSRGNLGGKAIAHISPRWAHYSPDGSAAWRAELRLGDEAEVSSPWDARQPDTSSLLLPPKHLSGSDSPAGRQTNSACSRQIVLSEGICRFWIVFCSENEIFKLCPSLSCIKVDWRLNCEHSVSFILCLFSVWAADTTGYKLEKIIDWKIKQRQSNE